MKKKTIIRLTESELMNVITEAVNRCIREDVLGDNFEQEDGNPIENNYEAFNGQRSDDGSHDWSGVGEQDDPTVYESKGSRR